MLMYPDFLSKVETMTVDCRLQFNDTDRRLSENNGTFTVNIKQEYSGLLRLGSVSCRPIYPVNPGEFYDSLHGWLSDKAMYGGALSTILVVCF